MKNIKNQLKQAFDALEFANVSQLHQLTERLNREDRAVPTRISQRAATPEHGIGKIPAPSSPCF